MNILIWESFGDTEVLCAETADHLNKIKDDVVAIAKAWNVEESIMDVVEKYKAITPHPYNLVSLRYLIKEMVDTLGRGHEDFETFAFSRVIYR